MSKYNYLDFFSHMNFLSLVGEERGGEGHE